MESNRNYFLVGLFVIGITLAILIFTIWIGSKDSGHFTRYRIRFAESVSGLNIGGLVKYRGVNVGFVEDIQIDRKDTRLIRVEIKVARDTPIKTDTEASLKLQGITGVVFIELTGGSNNAPDLLEVSNNKMPEIKSKSSPLNAIVDRLPEVVDKIETAIAQINKLLSDENIGNISGTISEWQSMSKDLRRITHDSSQNMDALMRDLRKTSRNISNLSEDLEEDPSRLIFPSEQKGIPAP